MRTLLRRPTCQLVLYLCGIVAVSFVTAWMVTPLLPFPFGKVLRRIVMVLALLTIVPFAARVQHRRWQTLGFAWTPRMGRHFLLGLCLGGLAFSVLLLLLHHWGLVTLRTTTAEERWSLALFLPVAALIGAAEELFFRGVVLQSLLADLSVAAAVLLSSAFYSALHFARFLAHPLEILPELFGLLLFGVVLASAYLRTRLLALSIGLHMSLAYVAKMGRVLFVFERREPTWLYGTDRWVNGALAWALFCLVWLAIRAMTRPATAQSSSS